MTRTRNLIIAAAVATGLLTAAAPAANASTAIGLPSAASASRLALPAGWTLPGAAGLPRSTSSSLCGASTGHDGQGGTAGTTNVVCQGGGLVFIGPSVGQIATVIGPTIISPGFAGNVVVSAGNASIGPSIGG